MKTVGRNEPCPCGSGRKYKRCCSRKLAKAKTGAAKLLLALMLLAAVAGLYEALRNWQPGDAPSRVWSREHGHWHDVR